MDKNNIPEGWVNSKHKQKKYKESSKLLLSEATKELAEEIKNGLTKKEAKKRFTENLDLIQKDLKNYLDLGLYLPFPIEKLLISQEEIKNSIIAFLYSKNALTFKQAIEMSGKSRREFEEDFLPKYNISMYGNDSKDIEREIKASKK